MMCIDLAKLYMVIYCGLTLFNFVAILFIFQYAKGWNKTANKIFYQRAWGIFNEEHYGEANELDCTKKRVSDLEDKLRVKQKI